MPASRWLIPTPDPHAAGALAAALRLARPAARVLVRAGLAVPPPARRFLNPSLDDLLDPLLMLGMRPAIERIRRAIRAGEKILIYGDYDVGGTKSVGLLPKAV